MSRIADPNSKIALLRAAEDVFAERGLAGAKVEDIARRAGLSKGAFYLHFESKDGALKHIVESFLARCQRHFAPPASFPELPTKPAAILAFCFARDLQIYEFLWFNRAILRILPTCQGQYDYLVQAFRAEIDETTREWIDHFRRSDLYRAEVDPTLATVIIGGAYNDLAQKLIASEVRPPFEEWLDFAQESFVRAFGTPRFVEALEAARNERNRRVTTSIHTAADHDPGKSPEGDVERAARRDRQDKRAQPRSKGASRGRV